jgi:hypothetical protein
VALIHEDLVETDLLGADLFVALFCGVRHSAVLCSIECESCLLSFHGCVGGYLG